MSEQSLSRLSREVPTPRTDALMRSMLNGDKSYSAECLRAEMLIEHARQLEREIERLQRENAAVRGELSFVSDERLAARLELQCVKRELAEARAECGSTGEAGNGSPAG